METSIITGKMNDVKDNKQINNNPFEVKSTKNNKRLESPEYNLKETYEQLFVRRLNFLKSLLNEDSRFTNLNIQKNSYIEKVNFMENKLYDEDKLFGDRVITGNNSNMNMNQTVKIKDKYRRLLSADKKDTNSKTMFLPNIEKTNNDQ